MFVIFRKIIMLVLVVKKSDTKNMKICVCVYIYMMYICMCVYMYTHISLWRRRVGSQRREGWERFQAVKAALMPVVLKETWWRGPQNISKNVFTSRCNFEEWKLPIRRVLQSAQISLCSIPDVWSHRLWTAHGIQWWVQKGYSWWASEQ